MRVLGFGNLTIKKFMIATIGITGTAVLIYLSAVWLMSNQVVAKTAEQQRVARAMKIMADVRFDVASIQLALTDVAATGDTRGLSTAVESLSEAQDRLDHLVASRPDLKAKAEGFKRSIGTLHKLEVRMANAYMNNGRAAGNAIMRDPNAGFDGRARKLHGAVETSLQTLDGELEAATASLNKEENSSRFTVVGISIVMFLFVTAAFLALYYKVIPPLDQFLTSMRDINSGSGDLTRRLSTTVKMR